VLNAMPGQAGGYTVTGGALPGAGLVITSAGPNLGLDRTLTVQANNLTGGTAPAAAVAQTTPGQYVDGVLGINVRFFGLTTDSSEPAPMLVHDCAFDLTRFQNYATYAQALRRTLRNSTFS
jgi:hypothetical protein